MVRSMRWLAVLLILFSVASTCSATYLQEVLVDLPLAYFRFEEPEGSTEIADSSGIGFEGFEVNNVGFERDGIAGSHAAEFFWIEQYRNRPDVRPVHRRDANLDDRKLVLRYRRGRN